MLTAKGKSGSLLRASRSRLWPCCTVHRRHNGASHLSVAELFRDNHSGALGAEIAARALPAPDDEIEVH
jgi:hypothetical protein